MVLNDRSRAETMSLFRLWLPTVSMMLVSLVSYVDRITLALLAPTILKETHLSAEQYGYIISAFSIAYTLANPVWGRLLDRIGVRRGMLAAVTIWSVASAAHAFAGGFLSFAAARTALGLGEGATFPGGLRTVMQTLPAVNRSRGIAVAYSGGSLGALLTPLIVTPVFVLYGWRAAFLFTGLLGLAWVLHWWMISDHPDLSEGRKTKIAPAPSFTDIRLWSFMSAYALGALPLGFVLYAGPVFLSQALQKSQTTIGHVMWIPPLGWEVGYFFWGWLTDRMAGTRAGLPAFLRLLKWLTLLSLPLALVPRISAFPLVLLELFLAMFMAAGFVIVAIGYATRVYSAEHSGWIAGIGAGSWGAVVAVMMPIFGRLFDLHRYNLAFALAAVFPVAGYLLWRGLKAPALEYAA